MFNTRQQHDTKATASKDKGKGKATTETSKNAGKRPQSKATHSKKWSNIQGAPIQAPYERYMRSDLTDDPRADWDCFRKLIFAPTGFFVMFPNKNLD